MSWDHEPKAQKVTPEMSVRALQLRKQGCTVLDICAYLGLSRASEFEQVRAIVAKAGRRYEPGIEVGGPVQRGKNRAYVNGAGRETS